MDPENDIELGVPGAKQKTPPKSLTLPPIELEKPVTKKKSRKRRRLRRRPKKFSSEEGDPENLFSQKSQSSRSSKDRLRVSSLESPYYVNPERMRALRPVFMHFLTVHATGYAVMVPIMWYYQHCSSEQGSLTSFDNMVAYTLSIVSLGCVVFSTEVQNTYPYNVIYPCIATGSMAYLIGKIVCNRELILILEMIVIVGIEGPTIYTLAVFSTKDFTSLTPVLTAAYSCSTILNVGVIYLIRESVPMIMLNIINLFIAYGLCLCIMQFPITEDLRYKLPPDKRILGGLMLHYAFVSLSYHTYLTIAAIFDVYGTKKFQYYVVNLTFYLEH